MEEKRSEKGVGVKGGRHLVRKEVRSGHLFDPLSSLLQLETHIDTNQAHRTYSVRRSAGVYIYGVQLLGGEGGSRSCYSCFT